MTTTFEIDSAALTDARRRAVGEVLLPAGWLAGCLVAVLLLPIWTLPLVGPLALVFAVIAVAGLLRLRRTRPPAGPLTLADDGLRYDGEQVGWDHVRSVVAHLNADRVDVRTGCPDPLDGAPCAHPQRHWSLPAELFGTSVGGMVDAFGRYVAVEEREPLSEDRLRALLRRPEEDPPEEDPPEDG